MNNILKINFGKRKRPNSLLGLSLDGSRLEGVVLRRTNGSLRAQHQMTVLMATHDQQVAAQAQRLIRLRDGAVVDDIDLAAGYPVEDVVRSVGQLG